MVYLNYLFNLKGFKFIKFFAMQYLHKKNMIFFNFLIKFEIKY